MNVSVREFDRFVELGFFEGERLELIHGHIVTKSPQHAAHMATINLLNAALSARCPGKAILQVQGPLALGESRPEPDLALLVPGDYMNALPSTALLVVEVAHTSLDDDRTVKLPLYASSGIPEYWIVDVVGRRVEVHHEPVGEHYKQRTVLEPVDELTSPTLSWLTVPVAEFIR